MQFKKTLLLFSIIFLSIQANATNVLIENISGEDLKLLVSFVSRNEPRGCDRSNSKEPYIIQNNRNFNIFLTSNFCLTVMQGKNPINGIGPLQVNGLDDSCQFEIVQGNTRIDIEQIDNNCPPLN